MDAAALSLYDRAAIIPGRSLTRSKKVFDRFAAYGNGAILIDTDGRAYIDMLCGLGAISLGYMERMNTQPAGVYSFPSVLEVEAAEAVLQHVAPWASWVRFTKTGSEATHAAFRIAKAATGRETVLRCVGSYHGWHEWCGATDGTLKVGDMPTGDVAAVFVEPPRFAPNDFDWLRAVRDWCWNTGALFILDSMIYGGRFALGGASQYCNITPDLECFGKAFGNGRAVSFVVGMPGTYQHGEIASGTFSGETSGLSAVIETLKVYAKEPVIDTMWEHGAQLWNGLKRVIPPAFGTVEGHPVCQRIAFVHPDHGPTFSRLMLERGVIWHPGVALTMYAHTPQQIDTAIAAVEASAAQL